MLTEEELNRVVLTHRSWYHMKNRCTNERADGYKWYGGRGIEVCPRWLDSFYEFYKDMGLRPGPEYSIDRKDNNGHYEPNNCRWATRKEQQDNKRPGGSSGRLAPLPDLSEKAVAALALKIGVSESTLKYRIRKYLAGNLTMEGIIKPPTRKRGPKIALLGGKTNAEWAKELGITRKAFEKRKAKFARGQITEGELYHAGNMRPGTGGS